MSELFLVRHAQASFGEGDYDRLSELGHRQSRWLGEYFAQRHIRFDRVVSGTLKRHHETAAGIIAGMDDKVAVADQHPDWNEYDFQRLIGLYQDRRPEDSPSPAGGRKQFYRLLRLALLAWAAGELDCERAGLEPWASFQARVLNGLKEIRDGGDRAVLVVSSGGPLAIAVQHMLSLPNESAIQLNLQTRNTGLHHCYFNERSMRLTSFNNVPHLETGARQQFITFA